MPGNLIAAACLLVIAAILGILSELKKDKFDEEEFQKDLFKKEQLKKKHRNKQRTLRNWSLGLIFASLIFSFKILIDETVEQRVSENKRQKEYDITIAKLNLTIDKSDSLLDSLRVVKNITSLINDSLQQELIMQKKIDSNTQQLIEKNKEVMSTQARLYQASDRVVNPLFPLEIFIDIKISMNSPRLKELKQYVTNPKNKIGYNFLKREDLPREIEPIFIIGAFDIYFLENPVHKLSEITPAIRQFNFSVDHKELFEGNLDMDLEDSTFYFTLIYKIPQFTNRYWEPSTTTIGFSDLPHCFLGLRPSPVMTDYNLNYIKISAKSGLQLSHEIWFIENKGIIDDCTQMVEIPEYGRVYIQKIVSKQSATRPRHMKFRRYFY